MTWEKFQGAMVSAMGDSVNDQDRIIMYLGQQNFEVLMAWVNDKLMIEQTPDGMLKTFGLKSRKFITSRFNIEVMTLDAFNKGSLANKALLYKPSAIKHVFLKSRDLQMRQNIQSPSTDGVIDELYGEFGVRTKDGGDSILTVSNFR